MYAILKSFCSAWSFFFLFYRLMSFLFSLWVIPNHLQNANTYMLRHTHIHTQSHTHIVFPPYFWKHTSKKRSLNQNPAQHWDKGHWHNLHTCQSRTRGHSHLSSLVDYVKSSIISNSKRTIFKIVGVGPKLERPKLGLKKSNNAYIEIQATTQSVKRIPDS